MGVGFEVFSRLRSSGSFSCEVYILYLAGRVTESATNATVLDAVDDNIRWACRRRSRLAAATGSLSDRITPHCYGIDSWCREVNCTCPHMKRGEKDDVVHLSRC